MRDDKPYYALRKEMFACDVTQEDLARVIGKGTTYVGERMRLTANRFFDTEDAYKIMEYLDIDPSRMAEFFPDYRKRQRTGRRILG